MKSKILASADAPRELEVLYRSDRCGFKDALRPARSERPEAILLQAWEERLFFNEEGAPVTKSLAGWGLRDVIVVLILTLFAGLAEKIPHLFPLINEGFFYPRNIACIPLAALIAYFCVQRGIRGRQLWGFAMAVAVSIAFINLLPHSKESATLTLAQIHVPCFLWSVLGLAYIRSDWRSAAQRVDFIRYNGELVIYSTIVILGGIVLTAMTFGLFTLIDLQIQDWYMRNVVIYGTVASPIVASLLVEKVIGEKLKIAPIIARLFIPLFFISILGFLVALTVMKRSPFTDRDSLITYNLLLLLVLALSLLSISSRPLEEESGFYRGLNFALIAVTLAVDVTALAAVISRFSWYGFSINRVAVVGGNLLVLIHLAGSAMRYLSFVRHQTSANQVIAWMFGYLPAYTAWTILIGFIFPLIFGFR